MSQYAVGPGPAPGVKVVAAGDDVPITKYADAGWSTTSPREPGYPADFAASLCGQRRLEEDNVGAVVAKIELGEGDAAIVYVTDAQPSTERRRRSTIPTDANVPPTLRRRRRPARQRSGRGARLPRLAGRAGGPGDPRPTSGSSRRRDRSGRRRARAGRRSAGAVSALFLGAAGRRRSSVARCSDGLARSARSASPVVLDALVLSLITTAVSLGPDRRARAAAGLRARPPAVPRQGLARGRSSTCRSCCRRRSPGWPCCSSSAGAGCSATRSTSLGIAAPVHDGRGHPRPGLRVGAVLHPLGAGRHRRGRPRPRGRGPRRRRDGAAAVPAGSPCPWPRARWRPAW